MKQIIEIEGMSCSHCSARVEGALNAIGGVKAKVDLKRGTAEVKSDAGVPADLLKRSVEELGFVVKSIS